jgi:oxalate decarboxylase/phosphoglucose isomerase-like protein (cupin superfamily)
MKESTVYDMDELKTRLDKGAIKIEETSKSMAAIRRMSPGQEVPPHIHREADEWLICLEGKGEYYIDKNKTVPFKAGQVGFARCGSAHGVWNTGDSDLVYFVIIGQPYGAEFLEQGKDYPK